MFGLLLLTVFLATAISGLCSLMEASLFAVPLPHTKFLADSGSKRGKLLMSFKEDMSQPISAILILNTVAHTIGAAVAGALAAELYGERGVLIFSVIFTLIILYLSEIVPKQIGSMYSKQVSELVAFPLLVLIKLLYPLVKVTECFSRLLGSTDHLPSVSHEEVLSLAEIGREEGVIDHLEGSVIKNVVGLDRSLVKDILTPRVVVFRLEKDRRVSDLTDEIVNWNHTRVPIYAEDTPDQLNRYVIQRDLFRAIISGEGDRTLEELSRPLTTVPEFMRADKLLLQMFEQRESICSVVDEHGGFAGLVTLEDIIEEIVGREILDEYDLVGDLRSYARILYQSRKRRESALDGTDAGKVSAEFDEVKNREEPKE